MHMRRIARSNGAGAGAVPPSSGQPMQHGGAVHRMHRMQPLAAVVSKLDRRVQSGSGRGGIPGIWKPIWPSLGAVRPTASKASTSSRSRSCGLDAGFVVAAIFPARWRRSQRERSN
jgi:hypothetical protein